MTRPIYVIIDSASGQVVANEEGPLEFVSYGMAAQCAITLSATAATCGVDTVYEVQCLSEARGEMGRDDRAPEENRMLLQISERVFVESIYIYRYTDNPGVRLDSEGNRCGLLNLHMALPGKPPWVEEVLEPYRSLILRWISIFSLHIEEDSGSPSDLQGGGEVG